MKYVLNALDECATRLETILKKIQELKPKQKLGKRDLNSLEWCISKLKVTRKALEIDLTPPKPRTITDALAWVSSKTKDGTFFALLTEDNKLIKTMFITEEILTEIPQFEIMTTPIDMKMNKIELSIPNHDFLKTVPKKAKVFAVISKNGEIVKVLEE